MKVPITGFIILSILLTFSACKKNDSTSPDLTPGVPHMRYTDLHNIEVKPDQPAIQLDLDQDGNTDLFFSTMLVGDPIRQADKLQYFVMSDIETNLAVNSNEESPVFRKDDTIPVENFNGYQWFGLTSITLTQKVTTATNIVWEGPWINTTSSSLGFQVKKAGMRYCGWLCLSVDTSNGKIVLHNSAISLEPERPVLAGR